MNRPYLPSLRYLGAIFVVYIGVAVVGALIAFLCADIVGAILHGEGVHAVGELALSAAVLVESAMLLSRRFRLRFEQGLWQAIFGAIRDEHRLESAAH